MTHAQDLTTVELPADDLGPAKQIRVHEPSLGLEAMLVIDNAACGPAIGGLRIAADVTATECARLARAMTLKNAAAGLPHGGGKSVIKADPHMPSEQKQALIRAFAHALRHETDYIFGPDMGTDEACMAWIKDEIGRAAGLPAALGGIPLDEYGATGWGLAHAAQVAAPRCGLQLKGARIAIQGFGAVGRHAARFLCERGAILVAASDSRATVINRHGIDPEHLGRIKQQGKDVSALAQGDCLERDAVIDVDCDIWIPAARPDVLNRDNADRIKARLILQGANIPCTPEAEALLHARGVTQVPDFIANAGGVICAAMELAGATRGATFELIAERIADNTATVLDTASAGCITERQAATELALQRVREAMKSRRFGILG